MEQVQKERVQKLLAASGVSSRREAEAMIAEGRVSVNGKVATLGSSALRTDTITIDGNKIRFPKLVYFMLHKPVNVVTSVKDLYHERTVLDLVDSPERIFPVGRLDKNTTGLLLLTNDGEFSNRILHPRYELEKTYVATLDTPFDRGDVAVLSRGVVLEEGVVLPKIRVLSPRKVAVIVHQGFTHVVKRVLRAAGYKVSHLSRVKIGPLKLDIPEGAYRPLKPAEVAALLAAAKPAPAKRPRPEDHMLTGPPRLRRIYPTKGVSDEPVKKKPARR